MMCFSASGAVSIPDDHIRRIFRTAEPVGRFVSVTLVLTDDSEIEGLIHVATLARLLERTAGDRSDHDPLPGA